MFVTICLAMLRSALVNSLEIVDYAIRNNRKYDLDVEGLICTLFDVFRDMALLVEQIRRMYHLITIGKG